MQVALTWNPVVGAATYKVYRSQTSGSGYQPIAVNLTQTHYTDGPGNLDVHTVYFYVLTSVTATNIESVFSSQVTATPVGIATAPTGVVAVVT